MSDAKKYHEKAMDLCEVAEVIDKLTDYGLIESVNSFEKYFSREEDEYFKEAMNRDGRIGLLIAIYELASLLEERALGCEAEINDVDSKAKAYSIERIKKSVDNIKRKLCGLKILKLLRYKLSKLSEHKIFLPDITWAE